MYLLCGSIIVCWDIFICDILILKGDKRRLYELKLHYLNLNKFLTGSKSERQANVIFGLIDISG